MLLLSEVDHVLNNKQGEFAGTGGAQMENDESDEESSEEEDMGDTSSESSEEEDMDDTSSESSEEDDDDDDDDDNDDDDEDDGNGDEHNSSNHNRDGIKSSSFHVSAFAHRLFLGNDDEDSDADEDQSDCDIGTPVIDEGSDDNTDMDLGDGTFEFIREVVVEHDVPPGLLEPDTIDFDESYVEDSQSSTDSRRRRPCKVESPDSATHTENACSSGSPITEIRASTTTANIAVTKTIKRASTMLPSTAKPKKIPKKTRSHLSRTLSLQPQDDHENEEEERNPTQLPLIGLEALCRHFNIPTNTTDYEALTFQLLYSVGNIARDQHQSRNPESQMALTLFANNDNDKKEYLNHTRISAGGFGVVWKAQHIHDSREYAIKQVVVKQEDRNEIMREVKILADLDHQNIVRYYDSWVEKLQKETNIFPRFGSELPLDEEGCAIFCSSAASRSSLSEELKTPHDADYLFIKMELCEGTLEDCLEERSQRLGSNPLTRQDYIKALDFFSQILEGVMFCHDQKHLIHRDIKPKNLFYKKQGNGRMIFKLGDFGLAKILSYSANPSGLHEEMSTEIGTVTYAAPEQKNLSTYSYSADVYSLGLVLYEMFNNFPTKFEKLRGFKKLKQNREIEGIFGKETQEGQLILSMTEEDPKSRPQLADVASVINFLRMIYQPRPFSQTMQPISPSSSGENSWKTIGMELEWMKTEIYDLELKLQDERFDNSNQLDKLNEENAEFRSENNALKTENEELKEDMLLLRMENKQLRRMLEELQAQSSCK